MLLAGHGCGNSLRSCTGSTRGHSSWTGNSRVCSSWTGSRMTHSLRSSSRAYSSWTGSSHRSHSPPWSPHKSHSPPWSPHRSHSPPWSPHRSHSWSRNRLAHSSTRACSSKRAHSSWSHSLHSRSHSLHSRSHSLQSSHSSPWFWCAENGAGRGAGERQVQMWSSLSLGHLYPCPGILDTITFAKAPHIQRTRKPGFGGQEGISQPSTRCPGVTLGAHPCPGNSKGLRRSGHCPCKSLINKCQCAGCKTSQDVCPAINKIVPVVTSGLQSKSSS
ncbi:uncharacterized protein [Chlorocebus sabaeus]|uniref:uncharacterized protein n=1 Tax=Chlorocebus sabaeus TaxID=60711 RepID=UPI003BFA3130